LGSCAARGLGRARLRRGRGAGEGGPDRRRLPHRRPDLFRGRPAHPGRPVTGGPVTGGTAAGGTAAGGPVTGGTAAPGQRPPAAARAAREYALVLGVVAAGALLVLLSAHQGWARVVTAAPAPIPGSTVTVSGQAIVPLAGALAVASLASLAAVLATRGLPRRLVGVFLGASG